MKVLNGKSDLVTSSSQYACLSLLDPHLVQRRVPVMCNVGHSALLLVHYLLLPLGRAFGPFSLSCIIDFSPWIFQPIKVSIVPSLKGCPSYLQLLPYHFLSFPTNLLKELSALSASTQSPFIPSSAHAGPSPILVCSTKTVLIEVSIISLLSKPVDSF